ncbi:OX-2 membrane glycoprotein-like [Tachyglossus aculeatus]|uniref:OX-2 membrane glycoprotein-like n=1 Tax=Tachyglossus aculeatus TaxID=9261 RepID=UPI0018F5197F|nr:OX-2 membrane glycoprotein-like [Tachyglossus aculeatus]
MFVSLQVPERFCSWPCRPSGVGLLWAVAAVVLYRTQGKVLTKDVAVVLDTPATLVCSLLLAKEVLSVTWQKLEAGGPDNVCTFSHSHGKVIDARYRSRVDISQGLDESILTFRKALLQDEGCYRCIYNIFNSRPIQSQACLTLYVLPSASIRYRFVNGHLDAACSATARPPALVSWNVSGVEGESHTESTAHGNGTTTVTRTLQLKDSERPLGKELVCKVLHRGNVTQLRTTVSKSDRVSVPLLLSIVSVLILVALIGVLLFWKQRLKTNCDEGTEAPRSEPKKGPMDPVADSSKGSRCA